MVVIYLLGSVVGSGGPFVGPVLNPWPTLDESIARQVVRAGSYMDKVSFLGISSEFDTV